MNNNKCDECGYEFERYENYVEYEGEMLCETCFFEKAIEELEASELQYRGGKI